MTAKEFAIKAHADQRYGDAPYVTHLRAVVEVLSDFGYKEEWAQAGWLHDVLEDTKTTREQLKTMFGPHVEAMVHACSGVGRTRKLRNKSIYEKIAIYPQAAIIKVADRIAHVEAAAPLSHHFAMYSGEQEMFDRNVTRFVPHTMRHRLDKELNLRRAVLYYSS